MGWDGMGWVGKNEGRRKKEDRSKKEKENNRTQKKGRKKKEEGSRERREPAEQGPALYNPTSRSLAPAEIMLILQKCSQEGDTPRTHRVSG